VSANTPIGTPKTNAATTVARRECVNKQSSEAGLPQDYNGNYASTLTADAFGIRCVAWICTASQS
jgi:hypothetical protein